MGKEPKNTVPDHLKELLSPTPSGVAKLLAAWDGLNTEIQILILQEITKSSGNAHLCNKIFAKALDSKNSFVRYLGAKSYYFTSDEDKLSEEERAIKLKIENDPVPLVRHCLLESSFGWFGNRDPEEFFKQAHEARLAEIREFKGKSGGKISKLISYAVENLLPKNQISEIELLDIVLDFFGDTPPETSLYPYKGYRDNIEGEDNEALWNLIPKVPVSIAYSLIEHLPEQKGFSSGIPEKVLECLTDDQLFTLLSRKDIRLQEFRKKIFFENKVGLRSARQGAMCFHFDLKDDEFAQILSKPDKEKLEILIDLSSFGQDLSLYLIQAVHDVLYYGDFGKADLFGRAIDDAAMATILLEQKFSEIKKQGEKQNFLNFQLYLMAKEAVPWKKGEIGYPPDYEEINFLNEVIVPNDTWATFMAFTEAWDNQPRRLKKVLEKYLPICEEFGIEEPPETYSKMDEILEEPHDNLGELKDKLSEIQKTISQIDSDETSKLKKALKDFVMLQTPLQDSIAGKLNYLDREIGRCLVHLEQQRGVLILALIFISIILAKLLFFS